MNLNNSRQAQILSRRAKVAELLVRGVSSHFEICRRLGMEEKQRPTVAKDIQVIKKQWKELAIVRFDEAVSAELAKLERLEQEYWAAWERSLVERQSSRTARRRKVGKPSAEGKESDPLTDEFAEVRKEQRDGNPAFLDGIMRCINKRCELLGINAPKKFIHAGDPDSPVEVKFQPPVPLENLSLDDLKALRAIRNRLPNAAMGGVAATDASRN